MTKTVTAEYIAETKELRLSEPLDGVADGERVQVTINTPTPAPKEPSWRKLEGVLSKEAGDDLARAVEELFPPWEADD